MIPCCPSCHSISVSRLDSVKPSRPEKKYCQHCGHIGAAKDFDWSRQPSIYDSIDSRNRELIQDGRRRIPSMVDDIE